MISRRDALKAIATTGVAMAGATLLGSDLLHAQSTASLSTAGGSGPFELPPLPYPSDALEPHLDAQTMEIHHGKHHAGYVKNLNQALGEYPALKQKSLNQLLGGLSDLPEKIRTAVQNQGGGHLNHSLFWPLLSPRGGGQPRGELAKALERSFKSFAGFEEAFTQSALGLFGSGWAWLSLTADKKLVIERLSNQDNPRMHGHIPLLGIDVWEHAYYLKYQNRRAEYLQAFFRVISWDQVAANFHQASKG